MNVNDYELLHNLP